MDTATLNNVSLNTGNVETIDRLKFRTRTIIDYWYFCRADNSIFNCKNESLDECYDLRDKWLRKKPILPENELTFGQAASMFAEGEIILVAETGNKYLTRRSVHYKAKYHRFFPNQPKEVVLHTVIRSLVAYRNYKLYKI